MEMVFFGRRLLWSHNNISPDGVNWYGNAGSLDGYRRIAHGNGKLVATGYWGNIATSGDGISWRFSYPFVYSNIPYMESVAYGNGTFVVADSNGNILTSSNGFDWTPRETGVNWFFTDIIYANNIFLAVSWEGVLASPDGESWNIMARWDASIESVAYGNGIFVAVGLSGMILTSPDGIAWTRIMENIPLLDYEGVSYGNGIFVIVGESMFAGPSGILVSPDGVHWIELAQEFPPLKGITIGSFVAVGTYGVIMQAVSEPMLSVYPTAYDFGTVEVGRSVIQTYTIINNDYGNLVVENISLTGSDAVNFRIENDHCSGRTLAYGESATFDAVFAPTGAGVKSVLLDIVSNDPSTPVLSLPLNGKGASPLASLSIIKTASPDPVTVGKYLKYKLSITNTGSVPVTNLTLTDTLPQSVGFVSSSAGCVAAGGIVSCNLGTLNAQESITVKIIVKAKQVGTITNVATVTSAETSPIFTKITTRVSCDYIRIKTMTINARAITSWGVAKCDRRSRHKSSWHNPLKCLGDNLGRRIVINLASGWWLEGKLQRIDGGLVVLTKVISKGL